jgi:hypothetical protein
VSTGPTSRAEPVDELWTAVLRRWTADELSPDIHPLRVTLVPTCDRWG